MFLDFSARSGLPNPDRLYPLDLAIQREQVEVERIYLRLLSTRHNVKNLTLQGENYGGEIFCLPDNKGEYIVWPPDLNPNKISPLTAMLHIRLTSHLVLV